jgi:hypothetical protein
MNKNPGQLTLTQQFTVAALAVATGVAAAYGVNENIVPLFNAVYETPLTAFVLNFATLAMVSGGAAGYAEQSLRMKNAEERRLKPWGQAPLKWWQKPYNP